MPDLDQHPGLGAAVLDGDAPLLAVPRPIAPWIPKACVVAADVAAIVIAMLAAYVVRSGFRHWAPDRQHQHLLTAMLSLPVWVTVFARYRLYSARFVASRLDEFGRSVHAVATSVLAIVLAGFALKMSLSRTWLAFTFIFAATLVTAERDWVRRGFKALRRRGRLFRSVVIVGGNAEALALCELMVDNAWLGYRVIGFVDDTAPTGSELCEGRPVLGRIDEAQRVAQELGISGVVVATTAVDTATSNRLARQLTDVGLHVELSSSLRDIAAERLTVRPLATCPMIYVEPVRRSGWRAAAKRVFDLTVAAVSLVLSAPVMVVVGLAIKATSRGPILFRQERLGRNGKLFRVLKFRTMVTRAEDLIVDLRALNQADGPLFKMRDDPRVTRVGRLLRRYSIDELPQLWNVLRGEMSLVGPRPALVAEMAAWSPELHNRLRVKPGVTGMWQVSGRSNCSFAEYTRLDLYYVDNWTLWSDVAIVAKTLPTLLSRRGAF